MHLNSLFAKEKVHGWISVGFKNTSQVHYLIRGHPAVLPRPVLLDLTFPWAPCNLQGRAPLPVFASGPGQLWGLGGDRDSQKRCVFISESAPCVVRTVLCPAPSPPPGAETPARRLRRGGGPVHQRKEVQL